MIRPRSVVATIFVWFWKIEISKISLDIQACEGLGHEKSKIFFAGANFIASRRRGSYSTWLVETIPSLYRGSYKQSFPSPGRRSEILDEKKKSRVVTRFGS